MKAGSIMVALFAAVVILIEGSVGCSESNNFFFVWRFRVPREHMKDDVAYITL
jgi:hypothetical protein